MNGGELDSPLPTPSPKSKATFLSAARPLLIIASTVALFLWAWMFAGIVAYYAELGVLDYVLTAFPFVYLTVSIYCGFVKISPRRLLITGVVIHLPIIVVLARSFVEAGFEIWPGTLVCMTFAFLWCALIWQAYKRQSWPLRRDE